MYRVLGGQSVGSVGGRPASGPALFMRSPVRDRYRVAIGPSFFLTSPSAGRTCERVRFFARAAGLGVGQRHADSAAPTPPEKNTTTTPKSRRALWLAPLFCLDAGFFFFFFFKEFFDLCGFHLVPPLRKLFFFLPVVYCRRACMPILLQDNLFFFFSCVHLR